MIYDTIIIGSGVAGMTAGMYAARRKMNTRIISRDIGGQIIWASKIENYPGFKMINNYELIQKMQEQVESLGVRIKIDEVAKVIKTEDGKFKIISKKDQYYAKTVIIAAGLSPRRLNVPGEKELTGTGVSYCANCDGMFFKEKTVAVIGAGNSALDAAEVLSKIAKKVFLIHRNEYFKGFEALVNKIKSIRNIEILINHEVKELIGTGKLEKIMAKNLMSGEMIELQADGVFLEIGRIPDTKWLDGLAELDEKCQIIIDENGQTSLPGIFAAGDVTQTTCKQIVVACAQGAIAALSAYRHIQMS